MVVGLETTGAQDTAMVILFIDVVLLIHLAVIIFFFLLQERDFLTKFLILFIEKHKAVKT
jgi:hypothetical protein